MVQPLSEKEIKDGISFLDSKTHVYLSALCSDGSISKIEIYNPLRHSIENCKKFLKHNHVIPMLSYGDQRFRIFAFMDNLQKERIIIDLQDDCRSTYIDHRIKLYCRNERMYRIANQKTLQWRSSNPDSLLKENSEVLKTIIIDSCVEEPESVFEYRHNNGILFLGE